MKTLISFHRAPRGLAAAVMFVALVSLVTAQAPVTYKLAEIPPPPGAPFANLKAFSNAGVTAGQAASPMGGPAPGYIRNKQGHYSTLNVLPGTIATVPLNLDATGWRVVGFAASSPFDSIAAMWDKNGVVTEIGGLPGDPVSVAFDRNVHGQVVGASGLAYQIATKPFLWDGGVVQSLSTPGFLYGQAEAIDGQGRIAGSAWNVPFVPFGPPGPPSDSEGFIIDENGVFHAIGYLPGGSFSALFDMNAAGVAVGSGNDGTGAVTTALMYDQTNGFTPLGTLPGDVLAQLNRVNSVGEAVGTSFGFMTGPRGVVVRGGALVDLNTLLHSSVAAGWLIQEATGIDDRGRISVSALSPSGQPVGAVLSPYPRP